MSRTTVCSHCNTKDGLKLFNKHEENENLQGDMPVPEIYKCILNKSSIEIYGL